MVAIDKIYELFRECVNISTDSRAIAQFAEKGERVMFFALKGENFDGNEFIPAVIESSATYCISDDVRYAQMRGVIIVDDVLETLQNLASYHRDMLSAKVLAITGSNGKTTTKELINSVLSYKYKVCCTQGNLNNHIGVPLTLLSIPLDCEIAIIEMGANHHGEIRSYCSIAKPDFGIITNIGKAHLEGFGSIQGVAKAKGELAEYLSQNGGRLFYDSSSEWLNRVVEDAGIDKQFLIKYSSEDTDIELSELGELSVIWDGDFYNSKLVGVYNRFNIVSAVAIGTFFGVSLIQMQSAIEGYIPTNKRSELICSSRNIILLDAYNANPSSMEVALDNFSCAGYRNKMAIIGDMKELGSATLDEHVEVLRQLQNMKLDRVILVGEYFSKALQHHYIIADWYADISYLIRSIEDKPIENAAILIKGSNSMKLDRVVDFLK